MDLTKAFVDWRAGKLSEYSLADLRLISAGCVTYVQNRIPDAVHLKSSVDDEIRRKETQESNEKLLQQTIKLVEHSEMLTRQTDSLIQYTVQLIRLTKGVLWLTIILGIIALVQIAIMFL